MTKKALILLVLLTSIYIGTLIVYAGEKEDAAVSAATKWLALIDSGEFAKSYDEAAVYFKNAITKDKWEESLKVFKTPLGELVSRKVKSAAYSTTLPGSPDGEYVVITFETSFTKKKSATETVTPMVDPDGKWRVAGYYIK